MSKQRISLCVITGNEETHIERFLNSFSPCFDELCIVRAIGNQPHDKTLSLAKEWCAKNGKDFKGGTYLNCDTEPPEGAELDENRPETWPHVDDFAAARNRAWNMGTGDWKLWADLDDILMPGSAEIIRLASNSDKFDMFFFSYHIPQGAGQERNMRERLFKSGISSWSGPIHENCHPFPNQRARACYEERVVYSHEPKNDKKRDPDRNARIMRYHSRYLWMFFELFREAFYRWQVSQLEEDKNEALKWADLADKTELHPEMRSQMLLYLSQIHAKTDLPLALEQAWGAVRIAPMLRDGWAQLAELELSGPTPTRARMFTTFMQSMKRPSGATGIPRSLRWHGEAGLLLRTRSLRADGAEEEARKAEKTVFDSQGRRFSLLHATRGRPEKALQARSIFMQAALNPLCVEHIFAIDEDDKESLDALKWYRHVLVKEPNGCVKAWNAAAADSTGQVLVQLSDDWMPCQHWDEFFWVALDEAARARDSKVESTPLVLQISDGHRKDDLLCMAICTRARYEQQGKEMFSSEYFGVFSDNEFSLRAFSDGVVVDARHITLEHQHPLFAGKPVEEWHETTKRQNEDRRYIEGKEIFNRRNPKHAIP